MRARIVTFVVTVAALAVGLSAQTSKWSVPRMPDGKPDMQGVWANNGMTPLERPAVWGNRATMTDAELADLKKRAQKLIDGGDAFFADELILAALEGRNKFSSADTQTGNYDQSWLSDRIWDNRTSLIIDPPDGRIPALTPAAQKTLDAQTAIAREEQLGQVRADSPQSRSLADRCILGFNAGPPMTPGAYNNYVQITQGPGLITLLVEMVHDVRVVPVDGRPRLPSAIRQYKGESRGRWEGRTLIIETTNFLRETSFRGSSANLHLVERLTRLDANTLLYEFTVDDPKTWTKPWTAAIPMKRVDAPIYEYACHEGNYALRNILAGARAQEK